MRATQEMGHGLGERLAGGVLGAAAGAGIVWAVVTVLRALDPVVLGWNLPWGVALPMLVVCLALPWALLLPVLRPVGYHAGHVALLTVLPLAAPVVGWCVGVRTVELRRMHAPPVTV
ncbi:hypothetical protein [Nocardioides sp. J54]|uniref:hypothetical protein n=1 Tax=Nocardioides sp. J54 TaxID=935866 RepID=UPI0004B03B6A|nr:hypothetical protein [Nocardioides sp. J54]